MLAAITGGAQRLVHDCPVVPSMALGDERCPIEFQRNVLIIHGRCLIHSLPVALRPRLEMAVRIRQRIHASISCCRTIEVLVLRGGQAVIAIEVANVLERLARMVAAKVGSVSNLARTEVVVVDLYREELGCLEAHAILVVALPVMISDHGRWRGHGRKRGHGWGRWRWR